MDANEFVVATSFTKHHLVVFKGNEALMFTQETQVSRRGRKRKNDRGREREEKRKEELKREGEVNSEEERREAKEVKRKRRGKENSKRREEAKEKCKSERQFLSVLFQECELSFYYQSSDVVPARITTGM